MIRKNGLLFFSRFRLPLFLSLLFFCCRKASQKINDLKHLQKTYSGQKSVPPRSIYIILWQNQLPVTSPNILSPLVQSPPKIQPLTMPYWKITLQYYLLFKRINSRKQINSHYLFWNRIARRRFTVRKLSICRNP